MSRHLLSILRFSSCLVLLGVLALFPRPILAQSGQDVPGVVLDASTREGIPDVILRIEGTDISAASDDAGRFVLRDVPLGVWTLEVTHIRYGTKSHQIAVDAGVTVRLEVRLAEEAIELAPLLVEGETTRERERRPSGASSWVVTREEVPRAIGTSRHMGDLIRQTIPGLRLRQQNSLARDDICLEFRAAATISIVNSRPCNHPKVLLDGVPVSDPQYLYGAIPMGDIERIQVIPPGEASTRYGSGSLYGVLLIETRRPGLQPYDVEPGVSTAAPTFDWELDPAGHAGRRTFFGAALGNALGLAAGISIARQCFTMDGPEISNTCGGATSAAAGAAAVVLPMAGAALGARIAGTTERSRGSLVPSLLGAGLMIFPGYALSISEAASDSPAVRTTGHVFLALGVPFVVTVVDRLYRSLR